MIKKILIVFCLILTTNSAIAGDLYKDVNKDASFYPALVRANQRGLMRGFPDGTFRPNNPISRGDYSKIIVRALNLQNHSVISGVKFEDLDIESPYYDACQIAIYYDLINIKPSSNHFYVREPISRKEAFTLIGNHLSDKLINVSQAKNLLAKYTDSGSIKEDDLILLGKADILNLIAVTTKENKINPENPLARADLAVLLYNLEDGQKIIFDKKIEYFATKKKAFGSVIKTTILEGDYATIPVKTEIPVQMLTVADSQKSQKNDIVDAIIPWNLVTRDKYLLIKAGSKLECKVVEVNKRKFLRKNGHLKLETTKITTPDKQIIEFPAVVINTDTIGLGNRIFKFKRIKTTTSEKTYIKLLKDIKIDLTSGLILN